MVYPLIFLLQRICNPREQGTSKNHPPPTNEAMLRKKHKGPASLFCREAEVLFGALKTKSCLSVASSFCLAQKSAGVGKKVQP